jgi:cystathionine beta-synthase
MEAAKNVLESIGNTPLVEIRTMDTGICRLFVKMENQNPGGSIKDRIALSMIHEAEGKGIVKPGDTIIEATAGNTGLGLALVCLIKGYHLVLVIPDKMSREKIDHLEAMGVEIITTRSDIGKGHPDYYQDKAQRLAQENGYYYINQFDNPANPLVHELTTGPEIYRQLDGQVDAVICGIGSSGTITGLSRFFKKTNPATEFVLADPVGSVLGDFIRSGNLSNEAGSWLVEGIGEDFIPPVADLSNVGRAYYISDKESFLTARELLSKEGIFAGSSSGTQVAAALKYCSEQKSAKNVVTFICDSGNKYLSKMFNKYWMVENGFNDRIVYGDLRDVITRRFDLGEVVYVNKEMDLNNAYQLMKKYDISQLPVIEGTSVRGMLDETDLLLALTRQEDGFNLKVKDAMHMRLKRLSYFESIDALSAVMKKDHVAVIESPQGNFVGVITKIDLLTYYKLQKNYKQPIS